MKRVGTKVVVTAGLLLMSAGLRWSPPARRSTPPYWGRIVIVDGADGGRAGADGQPGDRGDHGRAAAGSQAGAGSAVNDTTREVGGTLGVAVVGSVMSSVYGSHVAHALARLGVPEAVRAAARQSVVAGLDVAGHLPPGLREAAAAAARQSFMSRPVRPARWSPRARPRWRRWRTLAFLPARVRRPAGDAETAPAAGTAPADTAATGDRAAERAAAPR